MQRRSSRDWSSRAWRYGFAAGVVGLALLLSATMTWMWGGKLPGFLLLYPAVLVAAWAGGPGPGLLATVLSCLAISYFWLPPTYSFEISDIADLIGLVIFSIVCLFITALSEMNRRHETAIMVALRQSEQHYRELFERNLAGIYRARRDGRMVACNDAFVRLLGYATKADVLGLNAREFYVDPGDRDAWLALIRPGAAVMNHETVWRRHDGTRIVVLLNVEEREDDLIEGIALDITDRKRAEDAERRAIELRAITKLANAAAHEINNPLSVLLVDVTRMAREGDPRPQLRRMEEAARRIRDIVRRMLAITRVATFEDDPLLPPMLDIRRSSDDEKEP